MFLTFISSSAAKIIRAPGNNPKLSIVVTSEQTNATFDAAATIAFDFHDTYIVNVPVPVIFVIVALSGNTLKASEIYSPTFNVPLTSEAGITSVVVLGHLVAVVAVLSFVKLIAVPL